MTRTVALRIAYDGTEFHGWQHQPGQRTVQGVLEAALRRVLRHPVNLIGSGRTDAGVHAAAHISSFSTSIAMPAERLRHAMGSRQPTDIAILDARDVHPDFHATRSAVAKLYRYRIHNAVRRPVERLAQRYTAHIWHALDIERMKAGAAYFVGEHDFTALAAAGTVRASMVRTVLRCDVERHLDEIRIDVMGTGFLYKQVRNMVGTLLNVGRGHWEPERVAQIIASRDRSQGGPTAPARGLCLRWVRYPAHLLVPPAHDPNTSIADEPDAPEH